EGMLLYTDGVSEAQNEAHELFGEERIKELLRERHDSSSTQLLAAVEEAVERFRGAAAQSDDITMVALTPYKHA
ncbi:MAG: SpoIIE family protein phosphatase, partial [Succinivibrio sp.]|nr:SpoIIE family protein phosphatase [Succinivibrio sp.]